MSSSQSTPLSTVSKSRSTAYIPPHRRRSGSSSSSSNPKSQPQLERPSQQPNDPKHNNDDYDRHRSPWKHQHQQRQRRHDPQHEDYSRTATTTTTTTLSSSTNVIEIDKLFTRICCINLRRRVDRWTTFQRRMKAVLLSDSVLLGQSSRRRRSRLQQISCIHKFIEKVERFDAVEGAEVLSSLSSTSNGDCDDFLPVCLQWDATQNALYDRHIQPPYTNKQMTPGEVGCAMSHIQLWKQLAATEATIATEEEQQLEEKIEQDGNDIDINKSSNNDDDDDDDRTAKMTTMLILEDDATFYEKKQKKNRQSARSQSQQQQQQQYERSSSSPLNFVDAMEDVWNILPLDWDILYLGFSDRGDRTYVDESTQPRKEQQGQPRHGGVRLYRPTYGFHTHAYVLTAKAAQVLISNLPVCGPLDVWLGDNQWFGLNVYCSIVDGEGWNGQGANLMSQRKHDTQSDIHQSGR